MDPQEFNFLIARYNGLSKEIEFAKRAHWLVANGTLILYGIILNFHLDHLKSDKLLVPAAKFLIILVAIVSFFYLKSSSISRKNNVERLKEVLKRLEYEQAIEDKIKPKLSESISGCISVLYYFVIFIGAAVICKIIDKI